MATTEGNHSYTYDDNYQLTNVTYPDSSTTTYNYDELGNRTTVTEGGATDTYTPNNLNQYTEVNSVPLTYDDNGSLTGDGSWTYGYDYENRVVSANKAGVSASYTYDYVGRRIKKDVGGTITKYLYDGDQCVLETNSSGVTQARYIYGSGIDEPIMMIRGGNTYYYHYDGLGNVVTITDSSGNVVESYTYDVFGWVSIKDGNGDPLTESAIGNPYFFTGRRLDTETGLYYYRARYYDPAMGRFLTTDPVGYREGYNLYTYVRNNPVKYVDPWGYLTVWDDPAAYWYVKNKVTKKLNEAVKRTDKTIPTIPGKKGKPTTIRKTIDILSTEFAKTLTPEQSEALQKYLAIDPETGLEFDLEKAKGITEDVIEKMKEKHPNWPWEEWEDLIKEEEGEDWNASK